jgi:hypothetical protein
LFLLGGPPPCCRHGSLPSEKLEFLKCLDHFFSYLNWVVALFTSLIIGPCSGNIPLALGDFSLSLSDQF